MPDTAPRSALTDTPAITDAAELRRRRRGRSIAIMMVLVGLCVLFYAITIVKMMKG